MPNLRVGSRSHAPRIGAARCLYLPRTWRSSRLRLCSLPLCGASDPPLHLGSAGSSLISNDSPGAARPHRAWRMHSRKMAPSRCYDVTESGQADQGRSSAQSSGSSGAQQATRGASGSARGQDTRDGGRRRPPRHMAAAAGGRRLRQAAVGRRLCGRRLRPPTAAQL